MRFTFAKKTTLFRVEREPSPARTKEPHLPNASQIIEKKRQLTSFPLFSGLRYSAFRKQAQVDAPLFPRQSGRDPWPDTSPL